MSFADQVASRPVPTLKTVQPDGTPRWPLIVLAGEHGSGKSYSAAQATGSEHFGRSYWLEWGSGDEGIGREYAAVPGAEYVLIDHDGSWNDIYGQIMAAREQAARDLAETGKPSLLIVDTISSAWEQVKAWTYRRSANSNAGRKALEEDPDAALDVGRNLWNDARSRYRQLMTQLLSFPGVVLCLARAKDVSGTDQNGRPTRQVEWKVDCHESLPHDATAIIRMDCSGPPKLTKLRGPNTGHDINTSDQPRKLEKFDLDWLAFDVMGCEAAVTRHLRDHNGFTDRLPSQAAEEPSENAVAKWENALTKATEALRGGDRSMIEKLLTHVRATFGDEHEYTKRVQAVHDEPAKPAPQETTPAPENPPQGQAPMSRSGADSAAQAITETAAQTIDPDNVDYVQAVELATKDDLEALIETAQHRGEQDLAALETALVTIYGEQHPQVQALRTARAGT